MKFQNAFEITTCGVFCRDNLVPCLGAFKCEIKMSYGVFSCANRFVKHALQFLGAKMHQPRAIVLVRRPNYKDTAYAVLTTSCIPLDAQTLRD
jgi:hypothetical protein